MDRRPTRRARLALLGSLLLHAALVAFLLTRHTPPPPRPVEPPLIVEIHEVPRPQPPVPAVKAPVPPAPVRKSPRAAPAPVAQPQLPAVAAAPSLPVAPPSAEVPQVPAAPPSASAPNLADAATRSANRVAENSLALNPPKPEAQPEDRSIQAPFVVEDPNARVSSMLREGLGRDRVERGLVDPYFRDLGQKMAEQWKPEKKVDAKGLRGFLEEAGRGLREGVGEYATSWMAHAEQYGKTGKLTDDDPYDSDGRLKEQIPHGITEQLPTELRSSRIALVRLTQRPDGHLLHVELVQPSVDPAMDAEVMRELKLGEMVLPVPPARGQGIHDPIRSVWAFELTVSITPPIPMVHGTFDLAAIFDKKMRDEMGGIVDVRMPLSRRITKQVTLVSVE